MTSSWEELYDPKAKNLEGDNRSKKDSAKQVSQMGSSPFAMDNRDPNNLNPQIQVLWDDIIGEPEGLKTPDCCWNCTKSCYSCTSKCCYIFLVILFAPIAAFCNGINFACIAFNHVWCVAPCLRMWKINCATIRNFWMGGLLAICGPCAEACGLCLSKVKLRYQKLPDGDDNSLNVAEQYFNV